MANKEVGKYVLSGNGAVINLESDYMYMFCDRAGRFHNHRADHVCPVCYIDARESQHTDQETSDDGPNDR